ncbi:hypothetical protein NPIL_131171 [Nephila pilipes]|uniref:Uncharacterized protein n=1 Tax=Nephila pilipes TaxID=299642 RepID=A0A8X6U4P9_NEPPI|nr:hypothetical protein NPIL_131171 [Nephila pilipes]
MCTNVWNFLFPAKYPSNASLHGTTLILTGANLGNEKKPISRFAAAGVKVIIACKDTEEVRNIAEEVCQEIPNANIVVKELDLTSFYSIRKFATEIINNEPRINTLIDKGSGSIRKSANGFEIEYGANYLGHALLSSLLEDKMEASAQITTENVSSVAHL